MFEPSEELIRKDPITAQGLADYKAGFKITECPYSAVYEPKDYDKWTNGHILAKMYEEGKL